MEALCGHSSLAECAPLLISKALGIGIVLGGAIVKLPQIYKIWNASSAAGLSLLSILLELVNNAIIIGYSTRALGVSFNNYGEYVFIAVQNVAIIFLLFHYGEVRGGLVGFAGYLAVIALFFYAVVGGSAIGPFDGVTVEGLGVLQSLTIPVNIAGRLPQIWQTFRAKNSGQLAFATWFLNFAGSAARIFTTMKESGGDTVLLAGFVIGASLNAIICLQIMLYPAGASADDKKKKE